jgi:hypothetical protein
LLASSRVDDVRSVSAILRGANRWMLIPVATWNDAVRFVGAVRTPVMLCDRDLPGLDWPKGFGRLHALLRAPSMLLLADPTSSSLGDVPLGKSDILFRPVSSEVLLSAFELACTRWEKGLSHAAAMGSDPV